MGLQLQELRVTVTNFSLHDLEGLGSRDSTDFLTVRYPFTEINPKAFISSNVTTTARPKGYSYKFLIT